MEILKDENNQNYIKDKIPYDQFNEIDNNILSFYMKYKIYLNL